MATYDRVYSEQDQDMLMNFSLTERAIYGSSRVANNTEEVLLVSQTIGSTSTTTNYFDNPDILSHTNGFKHFELTNHLGNVMAVVSDKRTPIITGSEITGYTPELLIAKDYYPFGMEMSGRYGVGNEEDPDLNYRFGFNGQEKDDEWNGQTGSTYDFGARIYDARIGRWMACDPLAVKYPALSPYSFVANNPMKFVDPDGKKIVLGGDVCYASEDVKSLVPEEYRSLIHVVDNEIIFDITEDEVAASGDIGVELIWNMANSADVYSYVVADEIEVINRSTNNLDKIKIDGFYGTSKEPDRWREYPVRDKNGDFVNEKKYYINKKGKVKETSSTVTEWRGSNNKPADIEVDNQRIISPSWIGQPKVGNTRISTVMHEFLEMWEETENGLPYANTSEMTPIEKMLEKPGAHNTAVEKATKRLGSSDPRRGGNTGGGSIQEDYEKVCR